MSTFEKFVYLNILFKLLKIIKYCHYLVEKIFLCIRQQLQNLQSQQRQRPDKEMIAIPWESTWSISKAPILGIEAHKTTLYVFQPQLISIYEFLSEKVHLAEEIHLRAPILGYCFTSQYIVMITQTALDVRSRVNWQQSIFFQQIEKDRPITGFFIRQDHLIVQYQQISQNQRTPQIKVISLNTDRFFQFEFPHNCQLQNNNYKLDQRLILIRNLGRIKDVYAYQTSDGCIQSGILIDGTKTKKKIHRIGEIINSKMVIIKAIFSHQVKIQGFTYQTEYLIILMQFKEDKQVKIFVQQLLPSEELNKNKQKGQMISISPDLAEAFRIGINNPKSQEAVQQFMIEHNTSQSPKSNQQKKKSRKTGQKFYSLFEQQLQNYFFDQSSHELWISSQKKTLKISFKKNMPFSEERNIVQMIEQIPKSNPIVGIFQSKPIYRNIQLVFKTVKNFDNLKVCDVVQKQLQQTSKKNEKINPNYLQIFKDVFGEAQAANMQHLLYQQPLTIDDGPQIFDVLPKFAIQSQTEDIYVSDMDVQTLITINNKSQNKLIQVGISAFKSKNLEFQGRQFSVQTDKIVEKTEQIQSYYIQKAQTQTDKTKTISIDTQTQLITFQQYSTQTKFTPAFRKVLGFIDISSQTFPQSLEITASNTTQNLSNAQIQQINLQNFKSTLKQNRRVMKNSISKQISYKYQPELNFSVSDAVNFGTLTGPQLLPEQFPKEEFFQEISTKLEKFSKQLQQKINNCTITNLESNSLTKAQIENSIKKISQVLQKANISKDISTCLEPIIKQSMEKMQKHTHDMMMLTLRNYSDQVKRLIVTEQNLQEEFKQQLNIINQTQKSFQYIGKVWAQREKYHQILYDQLKSEFQKTNEQSKLLSQQIKKLQEKEKQSQADLDNKFLELNKLAETLQRLSSQKVQPQSEGQASDDQQDQEQSQSLQQEEQIVRGKLPSFVGSQINSQSPSNIGYFHPYPIQQINPYIHQGGYSPYSYGVPNHPHFPSSFQGQGNYFPQNTMSYSSPSQQNLNQFHPSMMQPNFISHDMNKIKQGKKKTKKK